jgi:glycine betaine/choline ABC-type transport system substrate-binding protein
VRPAFKTIATCIAVLGMMLASIAGMSSATAQDDDKPTISVGAVAYTEQNIMAEMVALILEDAGYEVERTFNLASEAMLHQAHESGEVDISVQYTGSGLVGILGMEVPEPAVDDAGTPVSIPEQAYDIVSREFRDQFGLVWLDQLGFNNTYAFLVTQETADELGLEKVSDLKEHTGEITLGTDVPFPARPDGLPGVEAAYDMEFENVVPMDVGLLYASVDQGDVDVIVGYSTDGRIPLLDLVILEDDREYFPPYYAAPVVDEELLEEQPEIEGLLNQLAGTLDDGIVAEMNSQVDEEGKEPRDVARAFLEEQGIIGGDE